MLNVIIIRKNVVNVKYLLPLIAYNNNNNDNMALHSIGNNLTCNYFVVKAIGCDLLPFVTE